MRVPKSTSISPDFLYWKQRHAEREQRRIRALVRGEPAGYGYWKDINRPAFIQEPIYNDVPPIEFLSDYRLEVTYKQANELINDGADRINMIVRDAGKWKLTYKNALKLPNNHLIRDINKRLCLFRNRKFYKII